MICPHCGGDVPIREAYIRIVNVTARDFAVDPHQVVGKRRFKDIVVARHIAMYLAHEMLDLSFSEIGRAFRRHHSTVMYACGWVDQRSASDPAFRARLRRLASQAQEKT